VKVICCDCKVHLRGEPNDTVVSHSYCEPCAEKWIASIKEVTVNAQNIRLEGLHDPSNYDGDVVSS